MNRREAIQLLTALPAVNSIAVAKVEPDDVIVLECDLHMSDAHIARIRADLSAVWPGRRIVVLTGEMRLKVVHAADLLDAR
jgi:hypothetical protein